MLFSLLAVIIAYVLSMATVSQPVPIRVLVVVLSLAAVLFAMIAVALLANELYNVVAAVICAILAILPCIGLLTILVLNQKATSHLQKKGLKVGFMGVDPRRI